MQHRGEQGKGRARAGILLRRPYVFWTGGIFVFYLVLLFVIGNFPTTIPLALRYAPFWTRLEIATSLIFSIVIAGLVACNGVMAYVRYQERKRLHAGATVAGVGTLGGFAAGLCPVCLSGLLPIIFGFFGVTFSLAVLPFNGLELQVAVLILLAFNFRYLARK